MCVCARACLCVWFGMVGLLPLVQCGDIQRVRAWLSNKGNPVDGKTAERGEGVKYSIVNSPFKPDGKK